MATVVFIITVISCAEFPLTQRDYHTDAASMFMITVSFSGFLDSLMLQRSMIMCRLSNGLV